MSPGWVSGMLLGSVVLPWAWRRRPVVVTAEPRGPAVEVDPALVIALVAAAMSAGAPVPLALRVVGASLDGALGGDLVRAGSRLALGAAWDEAWDGTSAPLTPVAGGLRDAWEVGAAPKTLLQIAADQHRARRRAAVQEAAGALGARLVLPLGLCLLPAFVLLGLVPVVLSLAGELLG